MNKLLLPFLLLLAACSEPWTHPGGVRDGNPTTAPWVTKEDLILGPKVMESTPVIWQGKLTLITWGRQPNGTSLDIYDLATSTLIATTTFNLYYPSAIVSNENLYVFGTNDLKGSEVKMLSTHNLIDWTQEVSLFTLGQDNRYLIPLLVQPHTVL